MHNGHLAALFLEVSYAEFAKRELECCWVRSRKNSISLKEKFVAYSRCGIFTSFGALERNSHQLVKASSFVITLIQILPKQVVVVNAAWLM